jgi:hypothetical protein
VRAAAEDRRKALSASTGLSNAAALDRAKASIWSAPTVTKESVSAGSESAAGS